VPGADAASDAVGGLVRWLAWQPDPLPLHVVCPDGGARVPAPRGAAVVRLLVCAADLPVSAWLELVAAGATAVTVHAPHPLPGAPADALPTAQTLLRAAGHPATLAPAPEPGPRAGRRRLLGGGPRTVADAAALELPRRALLAPAARARPGARGRAGTERARLLAVLDALAVPADAVGTAPAGANPPVANPADGVAADGVAAGGVPADATTAVAGPAAVTPGTPGAPRTVLLDAPGCTACGTCVRACPEQALALDADPEQDPDRPGQVLRQDVAACTGCRRCVDLCPAHALTAVPSDGWSDVLSGGWRDVARVVTRTCARCGTAFGGSSGGDEAALCPPCAFRRAHPFGSVAPAAGAGAARG